MLKFPHIETERCIVRLAHPDEASAVCNFLKENDELYAPWEIFKHDGYFTPEYWHFKITNHIANFRDGSSCCMNAYDKKTAEMIGMVNFFNFIRGGFQACMVGFKISKKFHKQGYMTETVKAGIDYIFDTLNFHRIQATHMPSNERSQALLDRLGFEKEGYSKDYLYIRGKWEDHVISCLLNDKWRPE